jgi:acetylornithine deacetylase/succinyl-diaminopimelate desuccinylase family protein
MAITDREREALATFTDAEVVEFLQELVRTPSMRPEEDCRGVAKLCEQKLGEAGVAFQNIGFDELRRNVLGRVEGGRSGPRLMFHGHYDTQPVEDRDDWICDPFGAEIIDGRIYGRGSGDDKASVVAQVMAAVALARAEVDLAGTLVVAAVSDEEALGLLGTKWLHENGHLETDYLVVGEQTLNEVAVAERAIIWVDVTVKGKAAHGAMPWNGANAVTAAAHLVGHLEREWRGRLSTRAHRYLPNSSLNFGVIQGGHYPSIVPDHCLLRLDRRVIPGESSATVLAELDELIQEAGVLERPDITHEVSVSYDGGIAIDTDPDNELVATLQGAVADVAGEARKLTGYQQGSDGRYFSRDGIPIAIFGPSDPDLAHGPNENCPVDQLIEAARIYTLTAMRLLDGK